MPGMVFTASSTASEHTNLASAMSAARHRGSSFRVGGGINLEPPRPGSVEDFHYPLSLNEIEPPLYLVDRDEDLGEDGLVYGKGELCGEFNLYGELFHIFISYRVATEGSEVLGNRLSRRLYDEIHNLSRDVSTGLSIPPEGCGMYPVSFSP